MPIVEVEKALDSELIRKSKSFPKRQRKDREFKFVDIQKYNTCSEFVEDCIGYNAIVVGSLLDFHKKFAMLLGMDGCKGLLNNKRIQIDSGIYIEISSRDFDFFVIRKGNIWGSIYAIGESEDVEERYFKTLDCCHKFGWDIDRLMPSGQLASDLLSKKVCYNVVPSLSDGSIDEIHLYRAWQCLKPPMLEAVGLGNPGCKVYDYDINWAFPWAMKQLPSYHPWMYDFVDSKEYHTEAVEGFLHCDVYINEDHIGPLTIRAGLRNKYRCFNPVGGMRGYWTKREIDLIRDLNLGFVSILEGSWIIPKFSSVSHPFSNLIDILEEISRVDGMYGFIKSIAPTIWGKFASHYGSQHFNPMYAATVSSIVRERILRLAIENCEEIVAITADGLISTKKLSLTVSCGVGDMKVRERSMILRLSDLYRYIPEVLRDWTVSDVGIVLPVKKFGIPYVIENDMNLDCIGSDLAIQKISFGSARRRSPMKISMKELEREYLALSPPDEAEVVELAYLDKSPIIWEGSW
jgi:hypothetical protein